MCDLSGLVDVARHWRSRGERRGMERGQGNPKHFPKTPHQTRNPKKEGKKKKAQREREICQSIGHICLFYFTYNNPSFPFLPPFFFFSFQFLFNKNSIDPLIIYYFAFTNQIIHFIHSFFFFLDWIFALYVRYLTHLPRHCRRRRIL